LLLLKFGRDAESQSDELGVEYSSKIGYDAHEMAEFFNTLARKSSEAGADQIPEFLSTHPNPLNRKERVHELADEWQTQLNAQDLEVGRNSYLEMIDGIVYGEDPRQGFVEDWTFYHPQLKFEMPVPNGWRYQNSPQQFQMAPADGKALMFLALASGSNPQEAAGGLVEQYQLQVLSSTNKTVNGNSAVEIIGQQVTQEATADTPAGTPTVKVKITIIEYDGLLYQLTGACGASDFNSYVSQFDATMEGFKLLNNQDKLGRLPERLDIRTINQGMTLQQALSANGIPAERFDEFAVLNGMLLTDNLESGTLLKVLEGVQP
ncbi:MAG: M48 family metalloprotease, partial [Flavobacteriales bacterium]|nr:M48 family metalloprotease [Flavobacteriales bacterium]